MRIGIDISQVVYGTGVSFYTRYLLKNLFKIDTENEYLLFGGALRQMPKLKKIAYEIGKTNPKCKTRLYPFSPNISDLIFNQVHLLPLELLTGKLDVFHSSDWSQPKSKAFNVTTIHDLAPIIHPKFSDKKIVYTHKRRLKRIYEVVDRIIVPSEFTKNELLRLGFSDHKVRVIYEAAGESFYPHPEKEVEKIKRKYKIHGKYIMSVGVGKRKNTEGLIRAYELAKFGKDIDLVIAGDPLDSEEKRGVRYVGMVSDTELASFYSGAEALIFPSFYEGFGLPILQAFACDCPVVTSGLTSMPEVAGDAAIFINPNDVNSIADGIRKALQGKKGWVEKGRKRVKMFSWQKAAKETLDVYNEAK